MVGAAFYRKENVCWEGWPGLHPPHLDLRLPDPWHVSPRLAQVFQPGLEDQSPESPSSAASQALPTPRQEPPAGPASVQRPPGVPPARSARRSPRGDRERSCAYLAGCGLRLRLTRSRLGTPHGAPLAPTAAAQALDTATFIFLNALGKKAKAKTAERRARVRGERGARAGSQRLGLQASGLRSAVPAASRLEPRPPETLSQPLAHVAAAQRSLARYEARGASVPWRRFPHLPFVSAPAGASRLQAGPKPDCPRRFVGFWPEQAGAGLGGREPVTEGSPLEALRELERVSLADPRGPALPSPDMRTGPTAELGAPARLQPGPDREVPGSSSWVSGELKVSDACEMRNASFDKEN
ncbi:uncharacterized protein LOC122440905 [Cervus canadensis]|uniref:uncharacterized protein LOC122440905 n=1 Tax=Cervus canadensis TaxID=1574408 RepID=UPI001C9E3638|nr:uncharacterized protein LOC122440905 [Cervus canadensis]